MLERLRQEVNLVHQTFPHAEWGESPPWILIPIYGLPEGLFNKRWTRLLIALPVSYPQTGPDNFFADDDLRSANGGMPPSFNIGPQSSSGPAPTGSGWGWFSWHPDRWQPAATVQDGDNLMTFLRSINQCLRGEVIG